MGITKVLMFGRTGEGKTCYMHAMYATMRAGVKRFTLSTHPDHDIDLMEGWNNFRNTGVFPSGTQQTTQYEFTLLRGLRRKFGTFSWLDYRGGDWGSKAAENIEVAKLQKAAREAHSIIICLPAKELEAYLQNNTPIETLGRFNAVMGSIEPRPVTIAITKADQSTPERIEAGVAKLIEELSFLAPGEGWTVMFCPVSIVRGAVLEQKQIGEGKDSVVWKLTAGTINPVNVHIPIAFALYCSLKQQTSEASLSLQQQRESVGEARERLEKAQGDWLRVFWEGNIRDAASSLEYRMKKEVESREEVDRLMQDCTILLKELLSTEVTIVENGVVMEPNV